MGIGAIITAILGLPAFITNILARVDAIEAWKKSTDKAAASAAIAKAQTDVQNAQTTADYQKAADEEAEALRSL